MYKKSPQSWLKHLDFLLLDLLSLHLSFLLAYCIRYGSGNPYSIDTYRDMAIVLTLIDIVVVVFFETFKDVLKRGYWFEFSATLKNAFLILLITSFYLFSARRGSDFSRIIYYLLGGFYIFFSYLFRIIWKQYLKRKMKIKGKRSLLIVTSDSIVDSVIEDIQANHYGSFHIAGIVVIDKNRKGRKIHGIEVVADKDNVVNYVCRKWVDEIFLDISENVEYPVDMVNQFIEMGVVVHENLIPSSHIIGQKQIVEKLSKFTVLTTSMNYATPGQLLLKRLLDIIGGLVGCLLTGIILIFVGPLIYIKSPGPIFFSQVRVGKNGKKFRMYKFRSMYLDAEERKKELMEQNRVKDGMMFKLDWDPRIIGARMVDGKPRKGIGNYIRDLSIDELPQFFNVLKGDMSLVGTRPPTVDEWEKYELHHRRRLAVRPGITGMWQVSGRSNITDFEEVVKLDTQYINEWNFGLDLKILFKTVMVVFKKEGSM